MKHYFTYSEIQNMSYFDFKLYVEAIHNQELEQIKLKEAEEAKMANGLKIG